MSNDADNQQRDGWSKSQIVAQALIPFIGLVFTIVFGFMQQKIANATLELARSNFELAKSQVQVSLLPAISNEHVCQRTVALFLAKNLDEKFAVEIARALVMSDSDESVREKARWILAVLSASETDEIKERAQNGANQYDFVSELRARGLLGKLNEARGYMESGNQNGIEKAIQIYKEVINQLSKSALEKLNRSILIDAQEEEKQQCMELAARNYKALFNEYGIYGY